MLRTTSDRCRPAEVRSGSEPGIILVDGMAGTGKSTTAQWISLTLAPGARASWYHENDERMGPALFFDGRASSLEYRQRLRERWRRLVAHVTDVEPHTAIVEGALLQTPKNATGK
jgi:adenylylsulfate kinase-like enzyme